MGKTLVATVWGHEPIMKTVAKYEIDKVILVHEKKERAKEKDWKDKKNSIEKVKDSLDSIIEVRTKETELNDLHKIASDVSRILQEEKENEEIVNITGGKKLQAIGCLIAAYSANNVKEIIYWSEEDDKLNSIPKFDLSLPKNTKKVLRVLNKGYTPKEIDGSLDISKSMVYKHLNRLRDEGYAEKNKKWEVTELGEFILALD